MVSQVKMKLSVSMFGLLVWAVIGTIALNVIVSLREGSSGKKGIRTDVRKRALRSKSNYMYE